LKVSRKVAMDSPMVSPFQSAVGVYGF